MKLSRLLQTALCAAGVTLGIAHAQPNITVNYSALDSLPPRSSLANPIAPHLTPPGMIHHRAVPTAPTFSANAPNDVGYSVPPIFDRSETLYNHVENSTRGDAGRAFPDSAEVSDEPLQGYGVTGAAVPAVVASNEPQNTTIITHASYAPSRTTHYDPDAAADDQDDAAIWNGARTVGEVLFKSNGYELDLDSNALIELNRLAYQIGNAQHRILLRAFGGGVGDDSREAHRMALRRGLAVRRYLIARGVSSTLIDVTAVGGARDGGPLDRVDVVASSG
jgi:outer membrane protein OmpA-like peptidoglycan-associated protein